MVTSERTYTLFIFVAVAGVYWLVNFHFTGPIYVSDEIGYLANAAFLTGHEIDAASSYHAGYSILLVPAFLLFDDASRLWKAIVTTNALAFGATFALLYVVASEIAPVLPRAKRVIYVLICAAYPAYLTGSGYALAQPAQLLVFTLALWFLLRCADGKVTWLVAYAAACGILFWIHPTGAMVVAACAVTLTLRAYRQSHWNHLVIGLVVAIAIVLIYQFFVARYIAASMTPEGYSASLHYTSESRSPRKLATVSALASVFVMSLGTAAYLTVSSLGFAFWGTVFAGQRSVAMFDVRRELPQDSYLLLFCFLSLVGTIIIGAVNFVLEQKPGLALANYYFFYGRYAEATILPILLIGIIRYRKDKYLIAAFTVLVSTLLLTLRPEFAVTGSGDWRGMNFLNVSGFWPVFLPLGTPLWAMFLFSVPIVATVGVMRKAFALTCTLFVFLIAGCYAVQWHNVSWQFIGRPGSLPNLVENTWSPGSCVGVDPGGISALDTTFRYQLFKYYLHNFRYRRTTPDQWRVLCDGPVLTYQPKKFTGIGAKVVAKEKSSGLALVAREGSRVVLPPKHADLYTRSDGVCLITWCIQRNVRELAQFSIVGQLKNGSMVSNGTPGFLFFGPYLPLTIGVYTATITIDVAAFDEAFVDVVASQGKVTLAKFMLANLVGESANSKTTVQFNFTIDKPIDDFQLRLFVTKSTKVAVHGYVVSRQPAPWP